MARHPSGPMKTLPIPELSTNWMVDFSTYDTIRRAWMEEVEKNRLLREELDKVREELRCALLPGKWSQQYPPTDQR